MSQAKALEMLPAELQRQILLQAETLDDLRFLIRASPRFHQVFLQNQEFILSATARRQFHPGALPDAIGFAKLSRLELPLSRESAMEYCQKGPNPFGDCRQTVITLPETAALCKLAQNVRFFIEDFARNSLPILRGLGQSLDRNILPEYPPETLTAGSQLSPSETGRLQRAFCRFEVYRCLFAKCSSKLEHNLHQKCPLSPLISPSEQASLYLQRLPDFQIVEINCIRDYLFRRLRGICSQLEAEAVETLSPQTFMFDPTRDVECDEWYSGVHFFCDSFKPHQHAHFEHLISLGLPYIRRIFEATGDQRRILFLRDYPNSRIYHQEHSFITSAIECLGKNPATTELLPKTDPPFVYKINKAAELDIPDAWQWAHPRAPPHMLKDSSTKGLRDWGYVFWDFARLQKSGILELDPEDVQLVDFFELHAGRGPSVQRQLVPASYFDEPEYSDMEDWDMEESVWGESEWNDSDWEDTDWEDTDWEDGETDETAVDDTWPAEMDTEPTEVGEMEETKMDDTGAVDLHTELKEDGEMGEIKMDDTGAVDLHTKLKEDGKMGETKMDNADVNNSRTELTEDAGCRE